MKTNPDALASHNSGMGACGAADYHDPVSERDHEPSEYSLTPLETAAPPITNGPDFAIPADPLHLCPNCKYNLTGLTHRRCPECGESFELPEARRAGGGDLPASVHDRRVVKRQRVALSIGSTITAASLIVPVALADHPRRVAAFCGMSVGAAAILALILKWELDWEWGTATLVIAAAALVVGGLALAVILA